jgi:hypothetical protein
LIFSEFFFLESFFAGLAHRLPMRRRYSNLG